MKYIVGVIDEKGLMQMALSGYITLSTTTWNLLSENFHFFAYCFMHKAIIITPNCNHGAGKSTMIQ